MRPDTTLRLDDFEFAAYEVPERISTGGDQSLAIHRLVGGIRVIHAMGTDDAPLEWSGMFRGAGALARSQQLEDMRNYGVPHSLTWGQFNYQVIVRSYRADYEKFYEIPYHIVCEVIADNSRPQTSSANTPIDDAVAVDMAGAQALATQLADAQLSLLIAQIQAAIDLVTTFAAAPLSVVLSVVQPVANAQARTSTLLSSADSEGAVMGFAGIAAGGSPAVLAAALAAQTENSQQTASLLQLQGMLGRLNKNLLSINGSPNTVTVAGSNLFAVADAQYGDPDAWTGIAKANGLTDPFISGPQTLALPVSADNSGGVLNS